MSNTIRRGQQNMTETDEPTLLPEDDPSLTVFADMKAALSAVIEEKTLPLPVPNRPNMFVRYDISFEYEKFDRWIKSATKNKKVQPKNLALIVLHATCKGMGGVKYGTDGPEYTDWMPKGTPQTFDTSSVQDLLGTMSGWSGAITTLYGSDGHMLNAMNRVIREAGYTEIDFEDVDAYDPLES